jgi:hypothetical protein
MQTDPAATERVQTRVVNLMTDVAVVFVDAAPPSLAIQTVDVCLGTLQANEIAIAHCIEGALVGARTATVYALRIVTRVAVGWTKATFAVAPGAPPA